MELDHAVAGVRWQVDILDTNSKIRQAGGTLDAFRDYEKVIDLAVHFAQVMGKKLVKGERKKSV
jgi:hypothetical protein